MANAAPVSPLSQPSVPLPPIVLAAGGTGGHMFPAEALARALQARGRAVVLITDRRGGSFSDTLPEVATHRIQAGGSGGGLWGKLKAAVALLIGYGQARQLLRMIAPAAVVGFGGYASAPTVYAAHARRLPVLLHEQNAVLGRANRLLVGRADRLATAFPEVAGLRPADRSKLVLTGNPVRPAIAALADQPYPLPEPGGPLRLLVTGGSQGARVFSEVVPAALTALPPSLRHRLQVVQQARAEDLAAVRAAYADSGIVVELASFFEDLPERLARAHLVICRSGASTVTELTAAGRPAILVPYLHAMDDHQNANARPLAAAGAGWVVPQPDFTAETLRQQIAALADAPQTLAQAAAAARALGTPDAAERLADAVLALAGPTDRKQESGP